MTLPHLPDPIPKGLIDSQDAYRVINEHGVATVEAHPACECITLGNGSELTLWYGGGYDDLPAYWTLEAPDSEASGRPFDVRSRGRNER